MTNPLVSVLIVNWNGAQWLPECLDSLLQTRYQPIEIVVVDNASSDESLAILEQYPLVKVIKNTENSGFAKGNNIGFTHTNGKYVVTLNNDMTVDPDWLTDPVDYLENDPELGSIACRQMKYSNHEVIDGLYHHVLKPLLLLPVGISCIYDKSNPLFAEPGYVIGPNGGSAIYRKTALDKVGGFEERFFAYHEDADLSMRSLNHGWKCLYVPSAVVFHRGSASFKANSAVSVYYLIRNKMWLLYKHWPYKTILSVLPWIIKAEIILIKENFFIHHQGTAYIKATIDAIKGLAQFREQRRENLRNLCNYRAYYNKIFHAIKIPYSNKIK